MCMADLTYPSLFQNRIFTMDAAPSNDLVTTVCDNVIPLTASQRDEIVNNGWACLADFQGFNYDRIKTWAGESKLLPAYRGGCYFGSVVVAKLQGLAYWSNQILLCGYTLVFDGFDAAMMRKSVDDSEIHYAKSKQGSNSQTPSKFKYD